MIVIGSTALAAEFERNGFGLQRKPADLDLIAYDADAYNAANFMGLKYDHEKITADKIIGKGWDGRQVEIEIAHPGSSGALYLDYAKNMAVLPQIKVYGTLVDCATLEMSFSLKKSHRHSPRGFWKHNTDYNLLRRMGIRTEFERITKLRHTETLEREKLRTPSLNKSTKDFFDDKVSNRTFIHDQIHEVMAHGMRPMFESIKIDPDKVACSKEKFFALSVREQLYCVQEEAYVIALERAIIPMLFEGGPLAQPLEAYKWAVMRICTTLCSGWFREWALEHTNMALDYYDPGYVEKFLKAVDDGLIERIIR